MTTDVLPETHGPTETQSRPQSLRAEPSGGGRNSSHGRWWWRGLWAVGVIAILASAAALIPGTMSSVDTGPNLTHTITRGDLIVTVTEQGDAGELE